MLRKKLRLTLGVVCASLAMLVLVPATALAQSGIAGTVTDDTGGVMPGVTVEAASPVLIEQVRTVYTDGSGNYRITDLRPGVYTVTFSLVGFSTVIREGVELGAGFTANIDASMAIGSLEESITVSGQSPVVDVQSATSQVVLNQELMEAIPTGRSMWSVGQTMPGVTLSGADVGGAAGSQQRYLAVHGSHRRDNTIQIDGMIVNGIEGDGAIQNYFNQGMFEEQSYQTSALGADVQGSGVRVNMIPRDGSNVWRGSLIWTHAPGSWQSDNLDQALLDKGLRSPNALERIFDFNPSVGGPIMQDKVWFFFTFRRWGVDQTIANAFGDLGINQGQLRTDAAGNLLFPDGSPDPTFQNYNPDLSTPVIDDNVLKSGAARMTWLMGSQNKFSAYLDRISKFRGHEGGSAMLESASGVRNPKRYLTAQVKYTGTLTSKLLVEAGWSENDETYSTTERQSFVPRSNVGKQNRDTGATWSADIGPLYFRVPDRHTFATNVSYVTGSHVFKTGFSMGHGGNWKQRSFPEGNDFYQEYRGPNNNPRPASVRTYNTPVEAKERLKYDLGIYVQDSWTIDRLTINPGIRFEIFNSYLPEQQAAAGRFVGARSFERREDFPSWQDVAPRFGVVYDVAGDGKTAVKFHVGKYMQAFSTVGFAQVYNPMAQAIDRRTWTDTNGNDYADLDEIGPVNSPFAESGQTLQQPDPDITRPYQWETTAGITREIIPGASVSFNYIHRNYKNIFWRDNTLVDINDYTIVNIPNPISGEMIPIYNLNPDKLGQVNTIDKNSDINTRSYDGFDIGFQSRVGGGNIYGGLSSGASISSYCEVQDPNSLRFCDHGADGGIPFQTQFKISGNYPLPYGINISGSLQNNPGILGSQQNAEYDAGVNRVEDNSLNVNYNVTRSVVAASNPDVGLTQSSVTVPLLRPGTKFLDRWTKVDIRLSKSIDIRGVSLQGQFDIFNALNANSILEQNQRFGGSLDRPDAILQGRTFAVGMQLNF